MILKRSFNTKIANNIANTGFKNVIATASDAGIYITPLNKIATPAHPQADLKICSDRLGFLNLVFLKKTNVLTIITAKKSWHIQFGKGGCYY